MKKDEQLINEQIKYKELMVIGPNGEQMGVKSIKDALTLANYAGLDLVLMNDNPKNPVARILDYGKLRYERQKKAKEQLKQQRASNRPMKEYRFSVKIDIGDFNTRKNAAKNYLKKGHKIKATVRFKGREMGNIPAGKDVLDRLAEQLSDYSDIESKPKLEGRFMSMILAPKK